MKFLDNLERRMGRFYIPNLMKYLCTAMLGVFILDFLPFQVSASSVLVFNRALILKGQVWRILTFTVLPPNSSPLFILLSLYFYYMIGTALENRWGSRRFNLYYLLGVAGNIASGFLMGYATNTYLNLSLFLAYAMLNPDMPVMLFFVLPVKMKWLALLSSISLIALFFTGGWAMKLSLLLSLLPFFLFFGPQLWQEGKMAWGRMKYRWQNRNWNR